MTWSPVFEITLLLSFDKVNFFYEKKGMRQFHGNIRKNKHKKSFIILKIYLFLKILSYTVDILFIIYKIIKVL